jgi:2-dehydropantoate 2-reductase
MRILILGAGGVGGYFGGRLAESGTPATFLVRPRRAEQLARDGLVVESPHGNFTLAPDTRTEARDEAWDLVVLSCKAYDLDDAIAAIAPAVGARTHVLPLLNGLRHMDVLDARFGAARMLGGVAYIAATLLPSGVVRHLNDVHRLGFGARGGDHPSSVRALAEAFARTKVEARLLDDPVQALWEKWTMLGPLAAMTCLMRAPVGRIVAAEGGAALMRACLDEVVATAAACGHAPAAGVVATAGKTLTQAGSGFAASMLRDIERGGPTEAAHIVGDLVARAAARGVETPLLRTAWVNLQAYETGRDKS